MKTILIFLLLTTTTTTAWAADPVYLVCDPQEGVTDYKLICINEPDQFYQAQPDGSAKIEISGMEIGQKDCQLYAGNSWMLGGVVQQVKEWSDPVPFVLERPGAPQSPTNIGLSN